MKYTYDDRIIPCKKCVEDDERKSQHVRQKVNITFKSGDVYDCIFKPGDKYEGDWKNGMPNGKGVFTYADGNKYDGDYVDDKRTGKGVFTWSDGNKYDGDWKDDNQQ